MPFTSFILSVVRVVVFLLFFRKWLTIVNFIVHSSYSRFYGSENSMLKGAELDRMPVFTAT